MGGFAGGEGVAATAEARAALGLPPQAPLVGFFSRTLEAVRGFDIFLRVAGRLHELAPELHFVAIGEERTLYGNETAYLNGATFKEYALAQTGVPAGLIHWLPLMPYDDFRRAVACLDVVILPLFEGAANWSLFEAMALGRPILASNRCYVPEAIRHGLDGILLDPYDVEGFARQALALLREPRRARLLGRSAQARARRLFSIERAATGYEAIIAEAISRYRRQRYGQDLHDSKQPANPGKPANPVPSLLTHAA
jgi:glycosyltransferase involved in cell wall biosynthesis